MPIEPRNILKTYFETGDVPTQDQFVDVLESYIHLEDDNLTIYLEPSTTDKRLGIGITTPEAPLGIMATGAEESVISFNKATEAEATWVINLNSENEGFSIDQVEPSGFVSRFFIQESDGHIGIGTTQPTQKLHIEESTGVGVTGIRILNTATVANEGFIIGHEHSPILEENGSFSIYENTATDATKRFTIRAESGNVGINELIPDTKLHVSRDPALPQTDIDLIAGTGIVTIGPMTANLVVDYRGIQARTGVYIGPDIDLSASELNLQRLGGDILIHGDNSIALASKAIITEDARLGLGIITPSEKIDIDGAIKIGNAIGSGNGTIRYTGTDFEGRKAGVWVSLTGAPVPPPPVGPWTQGVGNSIYYLAGTDSRVAIGANSAAASLDINDGESVTNGNTAAIIYNHAQTSGIAATDIRVGLEIINNGVWDPHDQAKNIGLYISDVSGQSIDNSNIAAVMNGNVVIGGIGGTSFLGANANRVLAIRNGVAPAGSGTATSVQLYSQDFGGQPTLHVLRGDEVVKLYKETALTAADNTAISDVYTTTEEAVINNLRTRLNELEARLQNIGILG